TRLLQPTGAAHAGYRIPARRHRPLEPGNGGCHIRGGPTTWSPAASAPAKPQPENQPMPKIKGPVCEAAIGTIPDSVRGKKIRCPHCRSILKVPAAGVSTKPLPPASDDETLAVSEEYREPDSPEPAPAPWKQARAWTPTQNREQDEREPPSSEAGSRWGRLL